MYPVNIQQVSGITSHSFRRALSVALHSGRWLTIRVFVYPGNALPVQWLFVLFCFLARFFEHICQIHHGRYSSTRRRCPSSILIQGTMCVVNNSIKTVAPMSRIKASRRQASSSSSSSSRQSVNSGLSICTDAHGFKRPQTIVQLIN